MVEARPQGGPQATRPFMGEHPRAGGAGDVRRQVGRRVVDHQHVDAHATRLSRQPGEHPPQPRLLILSDDDREAAAIVPWAPHDGVVTRDERPPPGAGGSVGAKKLRDGERQLAYRSRLAADSPRHRALAPHHERDGRLAPIHVPVASDPAPLPVIGHQDHGGAVELAALREEGEEVTDHAVGLLELVEVVLVAHPTHVAQLVRCQQLKDQEVGILVLDHAPRGPGERRSRSARWAEPRSRSGRRPRRRGRAGARSPRAGPGARGARASRTPTRCARRAAARSWSASRARRGRPP